LQGMVRHALCLRTRGRERGMQAASRIGWNWHLGCCTKKSTTRGIVVKGVAVMRLKAIGSLLKETFDEWSEDKAPRLGAALAYYAVFSLAPLLIIAIGIAGVVFGEQAARGEIVAQLKESVGQPTASAIEELLKNTQQSGEGVFATLSALVLLFFAATGLFVQ